MFLLDTKHYILYPYCSIITKGDYMQYPNNIKKIRNHTSVSHSNRGMSLENLINMTNDYYIKKDIALIHKKPTPIGVVEVNYSNHKKLIKKAYFKEQSTLDYNGVYRGKYIEFDAKETLNKTAFPLANVHEHQIEQIDGVIKHGGIAFLIIKMNTFYYLLKGEDFLNFIQNTKRKSIPYSYIQDNAIIIKENYQPALNYLKIIDEIYFKGE